MKRAQRILFGLAAVLAICLAALPALAENATWSEVDTEKALKEIISHSSGTDPRFIRLTASIDAAGPIAIDSDNVVTIDLNGHDIDRGLTSAEADGCVLIVKGRLTLTDTASGGRITGGFNDSNGGGVCVNAGAFILGGAAEISGNAATGTGGGVYVDAASAALRVSGGAKVSGNEAGGAANNVCAEGMLAVTGALTGEIGVTMAAPGAFAEGDGYALTLDDVTAFRSDSAKYAAGLNDAGKAYLGKPIAVDDIEPQVYAAEALTPALIITSGDRSLDKGTDYAVTLPAGGCMDAGEYTVTVAGMGEFAGVVKKPFKVKPKTVTVTGITALDKVYDGALTAALDFSAAEYGRIGLDELTVTAKGAFLDAGAGEGKKVKISDFELGGAAAKNYALAADGHQTEATASIARAPSKVAKPPVAKALTANGQAQALVEAGTAENGRMLYVVTLSEAAPDAGAYAEALPTAAEAGTYYVWYKVSAGDANHIDSEAAFVTATIAEKIPDPAPIPIVLSIAPASVEPIHVNSKVQLAVQVNDPTYPLNDVKWASMNTWVATVSSKGLVTGKNVGTTAITATSGEYSASVTITVKDDTQPTSIRFTEGAPTVVELKNSVNLAPFVALGPDGAKSKLSWYTSDKAVATVSDGKVTGKSVGTATISVRTDNNLFASLDIAVRDFSQPYAIWFTSETPTAVAVKGKISLAACVGVEPASAKRKFTWYTSNKRIATVSSGVVTGKAAGTAVITVYTSNNLYANIEITVVDLTAPTGVTLSCPTAMPLSIRQRAQLDVAFEPAGSVPKSVKWRSSNTKVATVSNKGLVTGKGPGAAVITVSTSNGLEAGLEITVVDLAAPTGVTLSCPVAMPVNVRQRVPLIAMFEPAGAVPRRVKWRSSNTKVATVSGKGVVTGKKDGTTVITVTAGNVSASIEITVKDLTMPTAIAFAEGAPNTLYCAQKIDLKPYVKLEPGTAKTSLKWKTSNKNVATVTGGRVTGKAPGAATITVTTKNNLSAAIDIVVAG